MKENSTRDGADSLRPIFIVDDDPLIADCLKLAALQGLKKIFAYQDSNHFTNQKPALLAHQSSAPAPHQDLTPFTKQNSTHFTSEKPAPFSYQSSPSSTAQPGQEPTRATSPDELQSSKTSLQPTAPQQLDIASSTQLPEIKIFADAVAASMATETQVPALILLDVLLTGPNGFTLLNELASYPETMNIPIVLASSLDLSKFPLAHYNIVRILSKETMLPTDIADVVEKYYA